MKKTALFGLAATVAAVATSPFQNFAHASEGELNRALAALEDCVNIQVAEEIKAEEASVNAVVGRCSQEAKAVEDLLPGNSAQELQHLMKHEIEAMLRSASS